MIGAVSAQGSSLGQQLGEAFAALVITGIVVTIVVDGLLLVALWKVRSSPVVRTLVLSLVVIIHFFPAVGVLASAHPTESWAFNSHWNRWGGALAWALPGLVVLLWTLPWFFDGERWVWVARGAVVLLYGALALTLIYSYRPLSLDEPLVEIVPRYREQLACGRTATGSVICLGQTPNGELDQTEEFEADRPRKIKALQDARKVFMGRRAVCALLAESRVRCLGARGGVGRQVWEATSSAPIEDVIVGDDLLYFVSPTSAIEVWSESGARVIAPSSSERILCGSRLLYRGPDGHILILDSDRGSPGDLGPAIQIACYLGSGLRSPEEVVVFDGTRLTVGDPRGEETTAIPEGARLVPGKGDVWLQVGEKYFLCQSRVFSGLACTPRDGKPAPRIERGDAAAFLNAWGRAGDLAALSAASPASR